MTIYVMYGAYYIDMHGLLDVVLQCFVDCDEFVALKSRIKYNEVELGLWFMMSLLHSISWLLNSSEMYLLYGLWRLIALCTSLGFMVKGVIMQFHGQELSRF